MLLCFGVLLLALGLLSGTALVLAAFGVLVTAPGPTLWITFPSLCLLGFALVAGHAGPALLRAIALFSSALLLVLALFSIAALVLGAAGLAPAPASTAPLWFVLVVGAMLGSLGAASFGRASART